MRLHAKDSVKSAFDSSIPFPFNDINYVDVRYALRYASEGSDVYNFARICDIPYDHTLDPAHRDVLAWEREDSLTHCQLVDKLITAGYIHVEQPFTGSNDPEYSLTPKGRRAYNILSELAELNPTGHVPHSLKRTERFH